MWGDGPYYGDTDNSTPDYTIRRFAWWALASGARGFNNTSGPSGDDGARIRVDIIGGVADLTSDPNGPWCTSVAGTITSYFTSLPDWHKLIPDTGSVFITSGRGYPRDQTAPATGVTPDYGDSDDYVAGSITPAGTLAVIYCAAHFSVTIDQSKMASGYTAAWVDPVTCASRQHHGRRHVQQLHGTGEQLGREPGLGAGPGQRARKLMTFAATGNFPVAASTAIDRRTTRAPGTCCWSRSSTSTTTRCSAPG